MISDALGSTVRPQTFILPHVLFSVLYHDHRDAFDARVRGPVGRREEFWESMRGNPHFASHPVRLRNNFESLAVPLAIHGDGVPVTGVGKSWSKSLESYNWGSLLGVGATLDTTFFMFGIFANMISKTPGADTLDVVWRILCWSLHWLCEGVWPNIDPWGRVYDKRTIDGKRALQPLAEGHFACVWVIRGDLEWFAKSLKLPWFSAAKPCCFCPCTNVEGDAMAWSEFRNNQYAWLAASWSDTTWRIAFPDPHRLFKLEGVSILTVAADWMHSKHLGTDQYCFGSVMHILVYEIMPGFCAFLHNIQYQGAYYTVGGVLNLGPWDV